MQSPVFKGFQIFHNYIRPYMSLDGDKTPAGACEIKITGENKWITFNSKRKHEKRMFYSVINSGLYHKL